jgi:hypothetical protein
MQEVRSDKIIVATLDVLKLVQRSYALAMRLDDRLLEDISKSLLSAIMAGDIKKMRVSIARRPHEQQIHTLERILQEHDNG